jgi:hypothetical protein
MSGEVRLIWTVDTGRLDIGGPVFLTRGKGHARTRCAFGRALCPAALATSRTVQIRGTDPVPAVGT